jgi:hypothetical protein
MIPGVFRFVQKPEQISALTKVVFTFIALLTWIPSDLAFGDVAGSPMYATKSDLDQIHGRLEEFKTLCGRYPFTSEGIKIYFSKPSELPKTCKNFPDYSRIDFHDEDGWGQKVKYISDGRTYRIDASHGFFVTDKSPKQNNWHWENLTKPVEGPLLMGDVMEDIGPKPMTEHQLEFFYHKLLRFKEHCGRYPLTKEGLKFVYAKASKLKFCKDYPDYSERTMNPTDGWEQTLKYTSDGKTYRIEASHGYSLTENSAMHEKKQHWDNPNPPPGAETPTEGMFSEEDVE